MAAPITENEHKLSVTLTSFSSARAFPAPRSPSTSDDGDNGEEAGTDFGLNSDAPLPKELLFRYPLQPVSAHAMLPALLQLVAETLTEAAETEGEAEDAEESEAWTLLDKLGRCGVIRIERFPNGHETHTAPPSPGGVSSPAARVATSSDSETTSTPPSSPKGNIPTPQPGSPWSCVSTPFSNPSTSALTAYSAAPRSSGSSSAGSLPTDKSHRIASPMSPSTAVMVLPRPTMQPEDELARALAAAHETARAATHRAEAALEQSLQQAFQLAAERDRRRDAETAMLSLQTWQSEAVSIREELFGELRNAAEKLAASEKRVRALAVEKGELKEEVEGLRKSAEEGDRKKGRLEKIIERLEDAAQRIRGEGEAREQVLRDLDWEVRELRRLLKERDRRVRELEREMHR